MKFWIWRFLRTKVISTSRDTRIPRIIFFLAKIMRVRLCYMSGLLQCPWLFTYLKKRILSFCCKSLIFCSTSVAFLSRAPSSLLVCLISILRLYIAFCVIKVIIYVFCYFSGRARSLWRRLRPPLLLIFLCLFIILISAAIPHCPICRMSAENSPSSEVKDFLVSECCPVCAAPAEQRWGG